MVVITVLLYRKKNLKNGPHGHGQPGLRFHGTSRDADRSTRTRLNLKMNLAMNVMPRGAMNFRSSRVFLAFLFHLFSFTLPLRPTAGLVRSA